MVASTEGPILGLTFGSSPGAVLSVGRGVWRIYMRSIGGGLVAGRRIGEVVAKRWMARSRPQ